VNAARYGAEFERICLDKIIIEDIEIAVRQSALIERMRRILDGDFPQRLL
jgi:hypothetical protein